MLRHTIHFSGHVQGVGFRYTTRNVARGFQVGGYVQNLADGRVRLVLEGQESELQTFLRTLLDQMGQFIRAHTVDQSPATGEFAGRFGIRN